MQSSHSILAVICLTFLPPKYGIMFYDRCTAKLYTHVLYENRENIIHSMLHTQRYLPSLSYRQTSLVSQIMQPVE